jgi:hypothetical protein
MANFKTIINGSTDNTADELIKPLELLASRAGIYDKASGQSLVSERGAGANLSVDVAAGIAIVDNSAYAAGDGNSKFHVVQWDATENVSVTAADPTNPRIDLVAVKVDNAATAGARGSGSSSIAIITGTAAASPTVPSFPADGNDYLGVGQYEIPAGATTVVDAYITDTRVQTLVSPEAMGLANNDSLLLEKSSGATVSGIKMTATDEIEVGETGEQINVFDQTATSAYLAVQQDNLTSGVSTDVDLDTETFDIGSNFASSTYTAQETGIHLVMGQVAFDNIVTDKRYSAGITVNGSLVKQSTAHASHVNRISAPIQGLLNLTAGDTVTLQAFTDAGVNTVDVADSSSITYMDIVFLNKT